MSRIVENLVDLVGNTPLLSLNRYGKQMDLKAELVAKLEYFNPLGSVKDRIALSMIRDAENNGRLNKDSIIIEPTSGNTGIGLAFVCAARGYNLTLVMPETMSIERRNLIRALGAKVVLTNGKEGMKGAISKATQLCNEIPNSIMLHQFDNLSNPEIHRLTTAIEILNDTDNKVDIFVSGVGTGGTITGVGEVLKAKNPNVLIVAVEPKNSPVLSEGISGSHKIQGIGAGFVPSILNLDIIDEVITVSDEDAMQTSRNLASTEGLLVGISSGAAVYASTILAKREENIGKRIVVVCPDTGERYLSTELFNI